MILTIKNVTRGKVVINSELSSIEANRSLVLEVSIALLERVRKDLVRLEAANVIEWATIPNSNAADDGAEGATISAAAVGAVVLSTSTGQETHTTIGAALAAASSGDVVELGPGTYDESVTIPAGVTISGAAGLNSAIISGALATGTRVTLGEGSKLHNVTVVLPVDATPSILSSVTTVATLQGVNLIGSGALGVAVRHSGTGTLLCTTLLYLAGACDVCLDVTAGTLRLNGLFVVNGTFNDVVKVVGGLLAFINVFTAITITAIDGIEVGANGEVQGQLGRLLSGVTHGIHITHDTAVVGLNGIRLEAAVSDILGDPGVTGATVTITGGQGSLDRISVDGGLRGSPLWLVTYIDLKEGDESFRAEAGITTGTAERGGEAALGEGDSYTDGMVVLTTDGTAGPAADGGNITDVSVVAASASLSTFTFQGLTAGHSILFGSRRFNGGVLKHWGLKVLQTIAAVEVTPHSFIMEIWDGAAWAELGCMLTHSSLFYRYANEMFIRSNTSEHMRYGITPDSTWATKLIGTDTLYWSRVRIITTVTTLPVLQQVKLSPSRFEANSDGTNTYHGISRFRRTIVSAGNVFGETGGVVDFSVTMGSGGVPTGWAHPVKNSNLNQDADAVYLQFTLPRGIDTSHPIDFRVYYVPTVAGGADVDLTFSVKTQEVEGVLEADPTGGTVPVQRTLANTETLTAAAGVAVIRTIDSTVTDKIQSVDFGPYGAISLYEGDIVFARLELTDDGAGTADIGIVAVEVSGTQWTHGERL